MLKHYIEYLHPGSFVAENSEALVAVRALPAKLPARVTGYRFFSRTEVEQDGEKLAGAKRDYSPWVYFGKKYDLNQLALEHGKNSILYGNIERNGYQAAVCTIFSNWYPLRDGETVTGLPTSNEGED